MKSINYMKCVFIRAFKEIIYRNKITTGMNHRISEVGSCTDQKEILIILPATSLLNK